MNTVQLIVILLLTLFLNSNPVAMANDVTRKAHKTTHKIEMPSLISGSGHCSATAIGRHALLTATHCVAISAVLVVDGKDAKVESIVSDGLDHSIYMLSGVEFTDIAEVNARLLEEGDEIFIFGNPADYVGMLRMGYVAGFNHPDKEDDDIGPRIFSPLDLFLRPPPLPKTHDGNTNVVQTYYDLHGFFGDSGSAIFDSKGRVTGVISLIDHRTDRGFNLQWMLSIEMRFTGDQFKQARGF
jgi:V8-like Glu-specific endopeptidase